MRSGIAAFDRGRTFPVTDKLLFPAILCVVTAPWFVRLKNPGKYQSVSAFSAIVNPKQLPWGEKAFTDCRRRQALGTNGTRLANREGKERYLCLIDQGEADNFLVEQLKPESPRSPPVKKSSSDDVTFVSPGYDHSTSASPGFIDEPPRKHHSRALS